MTFEIQSLRAKLEREKGKVEQLKIDIKKKSRELRFAKRSLNLNEKAQLVIQEVTKITQDKLKYHLSDICSLAMASIFPDPYEIEIDFVSKRGKVETDIWFTKDGNRIHPFSSTGGGAVDIAALSLRLSCWTLQNPKTRPILILDEPLHFVSKSYILKATKLIKQLSDNLNIQMIIVSHNENIIENADNIIKVGMQNGVSDIKKD